MHRSAFVGKSAGASVLGALDLAVRRFFGNGTTLHYPHTLFPFASVQRTAQILPFNDLEQKLRQVLQTSKGKFGSLLKDFGFG